MERLSRNVQLFSSFRIFQAIFAPSNSYFTEYSRWVLLSFVKIVVFSEDHHMIQDRNGPIINLDASARSASRIFLFHQRFLLFENVYIVSFVFPFFFFQKVRGGEAGASPSVGPDIILYNTSVVYFFLKLFFFFDRRIYESVNVFSLVVSRLQGYPNIEHLYLADSSLARVGFRSIYLFTTLPSEILFSSNSIQ